MPSTPRQIVQELLHGTRPSRPLLLPIVFALGARLENLPLREFLWNATKISNSLRQIRTHLRADGISCYFDPNLEAEALGAAVVWEGDSVRRLSWPNAAPNGRTPALPPAEIAVKSPRIAVAIDVIKRLNALVRDGILLMAGVTGPFTLTTNILKHNKFQSATNSSEILEHAVSLVTAISSLFAEAGANVIFIREESLPAFSPESFENWTAQLAPTLNVIRFYQALPVLQFGTSDSVEMNREFLLQHAWECVVSVPLRLGQLMGINAVGLGLALPAGGEFADEAVAQAVSEVNPVLITTRGDVGPTFDLKRLTKVFDEVRR